MNGMSAVSKIIFQVKLEVNLQSLGQKCGIRDFLLFLGALIRQWNLFENILQFSLTHPIQRRN